MHTTAMHGRAQKGAAMTSDATSSGLLVTARQKTKNCMRPTTMTQPMPPTTIFSHGRSYWPTGQHGRRVRGWGGDEQLVA